MSQDEKRYLPCTNDLGAPMDSIVMQWRKERPDIDPNPMAVCGDVKRAGERVRQAIVANLAGTGLDIAVFDVLLTLRRQGRGCSLSPSELAGEMMLSTSAMTSRLDRLEKHKLIKRHVDPKDRRGLKIILTDQGFRLADELVVSHVDAEKRLLKSLSDEECNQLRTLLKKIG